MTDDSAHGMTNPAFESDEEAKAQMKLEQYLEGSVSPLEPVSPNPPQRHCDPDHYRLLAFFCLHICMQPAQEESMLFEMLSEGPNTKGAGMHHRSRMCVRCV